jgi:hypothetical protein
MSNSVRKSCGGLYLSRKSLKDLISCVKLGKDYEFKIYGIWKPSGFPVYDASETVGTDAEDLNYFSLLFEEGSHIILNRLDIRDTICPAPRVGDTIRFRPTNSQRKRIITAKFWMDVMSLDN